MSQELAIAISEFKKLKVLVIGDSIVDAYFYGSVNRISPEAPVPVVAVNKKEYRLGGAANVALNLKALGAQPLLISLVGEDDMAAVFKSAMDDAGIDSRLLVSDASRPTTVKTRVISQYQQMIRLDEESTSTASQTVHTTLQKTIEKVIEEEDLNAIIFEDYDKGLISESLIRATVSAADARNIPIAVDPKKRNFWNYAGVTLFKPNLKELEEGLNTPGIIADEASLSKVFATMNIKMPVGIGFFTLSGKGVFITNGKEAHHIPAHHRNIADVSGAGDTVISTATCALAAGLSLKDVAALANLAGGLVCEQVGVVPINADWLTSEVSSIKR